MAAIVDWEMCTVGDPLLDLGWLLATGTQGLEIDNLSIDAERDGIDLDCVRDASIRRCRVNTPNDDAIVVKSSLALGRPIASENVTISDCHVAGP